MTLTPEEQNIIRRLADGEDPYVIDPYNGCTNPLTGYFPAQEVQAEKRRREYQEMKLRDRYGTSPVPHEPAVTPQEDEAMDDLARALEEREGRRELRRQGHEVNPPAAGAVAPAPDKTGLESTEERNLRLDRERKAAREAKLNDQPSARDPLAGMKHIFGS